MKILAIEREFGSGGREVGMKLAEKAGIPYYDGNIMEETAKEYGISLDLLKEYDEKKTGSFLYNIAMFANYGNPDGKGNVYNLFFKLQDMVKKICMKGPAVFIGRCTTEMLRDNNNVIKVYIYSSDKEKRLQRVAKTEGVSQEEAKRLMDKKDRERRDYFKFWTGKNWAERGNYDIELNTSKFSTEECAEILFHLINM